MCRAREAVGQKLWGFVCLEGLQKVAEASRADVTGRASAGRHWVACAGCFHALSSAALCCTAGRVRCCCVMLISSELPLPCLLVAALHVTIKAHMCADLTNSLPSRDPAHIPRSRIQPASKHVEYGGLKRRRGASG